MACDWCFGGVRLTILNWNAIIDRTIKQMNRDERASSAST
jgi:hypothetical protein